MSIGKADYELAFKTSADLDGAKQTLDELKKLSEAQREFGQDSSATDEKIADLEKRIESFGKKGEEGFKILGRGAHESHAAIHALGEAFPGLTEMARFMANGVTAAIGLVVLIFSKLKEAIDESTKALDDLADSPGARSEWIDNQKIAAEQAAVSFSVWEASLNRMTGAAETLRETMAALVLSQNLQIQTANQIAAAQRAIEEAKVDLALKLGQITPEQAIKIKLQLDEAAFKEQVEIKIKEIEAEINDKIHEASQATDNTRGLGEKVNQTEAAKRTAEQAKIRNQGNLDQDKENLKRSQEELEKAQKQIEDLESKGTFGHGYDITDPQYWLTKSQRDAAQNTVESELKRQGMLRHSIQQEEEKQPGLDTAAQTSAKAAEDARKQYEDSQKEMLEARKQAAKLQEQLEVEKAKASALESLHNQAAEIHAQGQEVDAYRRLSEAIQSGRATPEQEREWNQTTRPPGTQTSASGGAPQQGGVDIEAARRALTNLQMRHYTGHNPSDSQIVELLNEFVALGHDLHATSAQRSELDQLQQAVESLRRDVQNQESRLSSGQYIH